MSAAFQFHRVVNVISSLPLFAVTPVLQATTSQHGHHLCLPVPPLPPSMSPILSSTLGPILRSRSGPTRKASKFHKAPSAMSYWPLSVTAMLNTAPKLADFLRLLSLLLVLPHRLPETSTPRLPMTLL